jgi:hypothetical protein
VQYFLGNQAETSLYSLLVLTLSSFCIS